MIRIYREYHGERICKAEWEVTSAVNLRNAILAVFHARFLQPPIGPLLIGVDGELYSPVQLPSPGKKLLDQCGYWLYAVEQARKDRPGFGL